MPRWGWAVVAGVVGVALAAALLLLNPPETGVSLAPPPPVVSGAEPQQAPDAVDGAVAGDGGGSSDQANVSGQGQASAGGQAAAAGGSAEVPFEGPPLNHPGRKAWEAKENDPGVYAADRLGPSWNAIEYALRTSGREDENTRQLRAQSVLVAGDVRKLRRSPEDVEWADLESRQRELVGLVRQSEHASHPDVQAAVARIESVIVGYHAGVTANNAKEESP